MKKAALLALFATAVLAIPSTSSAHEYNRSVEGHPLRYIAYLFHPVGVAAERFILKPIHRMVSSDAEFLDAPSYEWFGHVPVEGRPEPVIAMAEPQVIYQEVEVIREVEVPVRELDRYSIPTDLLFAPGKDILTDAGKAELDRAMGEIKDKYPGQSINIEGHTDTDPIVVSNWKSNWELGAARGLAVLHYLEDHHSVQGNLLSATTYSYHRPVAGNETSDGKAQNRRAEIVIYAAPAAPAVDTSAVEPAAEMTVESPSGSAGVVESIN